VLIITLSTYIIYCYYYHDDKMIRCHDCGTEMNLTNSVPGEIIECPACGIDHEVIGQNVIMLQIGLSEE